jgi:hypothetical protein
VLLVLPAAAASLLALPVLLGVLTRDVLTLLLLLLLLLLLIIMMMMVLRRPLRSWKHLRNHQNRHHHLLLVPPLFQQLVMVCPVLAQMLQRLLEPELVLQQGLNYCLDVEQTLRVLHQNHQSHHHPSHLLLACLRQQQELCWLPQQQQVLELLQTVQVELRAHLQQVTPCVLLQSGVLQQAVLLMSSALHRDLLTVVGACWFLCLQWKLH